MDVSSLDIPAGQTTAAGTNAAGTTLGRGSTVSVQPHHDPDAAVLYHRIDPSSPYYLGSSDNPGILISTVRLTGANYDEWSRSIRLSLRGRRKFGFIDGTLVKPLNPDFLADWDAVQSTLVQWIMNTIDPSQKRTIPYFEEAKPLWDLLRRRYTVSHGQRKQDLTRALAECKQTPDMSVADYFGKLEKLWDDLAVCNSAPACVCGAGAQFQERLDEDKFHAFLYGLDPTRFGPLRSQLLAQDPTPTLDWAFHAMNQEEHIRSRDTSAPSSSADAMTFAMHTRPKGAPEPKSRSAAITTCTFCHRSGHDEDTCFGKHGFPEWWGARPQARGRGGAAGRGASRGANGGTRPRAAEARVAASEGIDSIPGVSSDQLQQLLSILGSSNVTRPTDRLAGKPLPHLWIIDSGASNHVTGNLTLLSDIRHMSPCTVTLPDGSQVTSTQCGEVRLSPSLTLHTVYYAPQFDCNLISITHLTDDLDCVIHCVQHGCIIQDRRTRMLIGLGERRGGLYYFRGGADVAVNRVIAQQDPEVWHRRLGHPSPRVVTCLPFSFTSNKSLDKPCDICYQAKQSRDSFPLSDNKAVSSFDLVHCDLWGPYRVRSSCGARFFLTIVDDFSRAVWIFLLVDKTEVFTVFTRFLALVERQFHSKVKTVRSDNGTEFFCLKNYFSDHGIIFQTSCVNTPQQNGRVERKHRHILNVARALKFQANLPTQFWGECVLTAGYLINRTPSPILANKSPYECLFNAPPRYSELRVFGCLCYAHNWKAKLDKFSPRSRRCVFLGYPFGKKGWKVYDLDTKEFFVSRDVKFLEASFPFALESSSAVASAVPVSNIFEEDLWLEVPPPTPHHDDSPVVVAHRHSTNVADPLIADPLIAEDTNVAKDTTGATASEVADRSIARAEDTIVAEDTTGATASEVADHSIVRADEEGYEPDELTTDSVADVALGRGMRSKVPSVRLRDFVVNTIIGSTSASTPASTDSTPYALSQFVDSSCFSLEHRVFLAAISAEDEPRSFREAMKHPGWRQAMRTEIDALENNGTWTLVTLPEGKKALGSRWIYKIKHRSDGTVERLKARLVVFGNHQVEGIDYTDTFAPVAKMTTVRVFLAVAAAKDWELHQMDVHNAFLHGDLAEEVYMRIPPGFEKGRDGQVCRLRKSLYGLKQAPRCWFAKFADALKQYGFAQSYSDYSLFTYSKEAVRLHVLVYVDDLIIAGNNSGAVTLFKQYLHTCFRMKDLGKLKYFLGIEVARNRKGIFLCQRKYALDIISETGLLGAKPVSFPMEQNQKLGLSTSPDLEDGAKYRRLVGRLLYLAFTRPDICFAVHILSQFLQHPKEDHWVAALRVVRYLKGSPGQGVLLRRDCSLELAGWCDSDWAACPTTRRSVSGWIVFLGASPVSWKSKKQDTVSLSSAEAEYRAMTKITCELKWLRGLLRSLDVRPPEPMQLYCDSQSALHLARNPVFHERSKHIEIDCHFTRDALLDGTISTSHVPTSEQLADIFTKPLGMKQFLVIRDKLGIHDLHAPA